VAGAIVALALGRRSWERYGTGLLVSDRDQAGGESGRPGEREEEIRQLLEARNVRRRRRGERELDAASELGRLARATGVDAPGASPRAPAVAPELREELRSLVVARNLRRARRGEPELDVEAEVERQMADLARLV
ncbi:MAG: hypothetical protein ACRDMJ_15590, partial [Solirubrobacteraceae bacterium]